MKKIKPRTLPCVSSKELRSLRGGFVVIEDDVILREESASDESFIIIDDDIDGI